MVNYSAYLKFRVEAVVHHFNFDHLIIRGFFWREDLFLLSGNLSRGFVQPQQFHDYSSSLNTQETVPTLYHPCFYAALDGAVILKLISPDYLFK